MLSLSLVALTLLSSSPAADIGSADLRSCINVSTLAAPLSSIAEERAKAGPVEWAQACRQARDADERRRSVVSTVLRTGEPPLQGWASSASFSKLAQTTSDPDVAELFRRAARDQAARESLAPQAQSQFAGGLSPLAIKLLRGLVSNEAVAVDQDNRAWLSETVARRGWFTIGRDGAKADAAAWLLVQHGDQDRSFQRRMIAILEPLLDQGQTERKRFPYLFDRWAAGAGAPQRFGLQGRCVGPGEWRPLPIEDEGRLDVRRHQFGLTTTFAEQVRENAARCS